jgi:hypothetical protein
MQMSTSRALATSAAMAPKAVIQRTVTQDEAQPSQSKITPSDQNNQRAAAALISVLEACDDEGVEWF